jgi:predicted transcriptional regulator
MDYSKIIEHDTLVRDNSTGAVINIDKITFEDIKRIRNGNFSMKQLQSDVENLKHELSDIKNLLRELIRHGG